MWHQLCKDYKLYRFNCETLSVEPVCENIDVLNYSFYKNAVLCTTYDDNDDGRGLYRIHSNDKRKILSNVNHLRKDTKTSATDLI